MELLLMGVAIGVVLAAWTSVLIKEWENRPRLKRNAMADGESLENRLDALLEAGAEIAGRDAADRAKAFLKSVEHSETDA